MPQAFLACLKTVIFVIQAGSLFDHLLQLRLELIQRDYLRAVGVNEFSSSVASLSKAS